MFAEELRRVGVSGLTARLFARHTSKKAGWFHATSMSALGHNRTWLHLAEWTKVSAG
jgi:hypothetical protein